MTRFRRSRGDDGFGGFFPLRKPDDLFEKVRHDYSRMLTDRLDVYAAYDFFVTANHLVEWTWPSDSDARRDVRERDALPRICEHVANGATHFVLKRRQRAAFHTDQADAPGSDLDSAFSDPGEFPSPIFGAEDGLFVTLQAAEAGAIGMRRISAPALALLVVNYWSKRVSQPT
jgi:hypothetical protein